MAKLAVLGGTPVAENGMHVVWPEIGDEDREALLRTFESRNWCRFGLPDDICEAAKFEREWAAYHDAKRCIAVNNGTAALMCAFRTLGIGHGDEVIVPAITFTATSDAVALCGAVPVFVDMDPETYQIDAGAAEDAITGKTKAICAVHYAGYPADLDRLSALSAKTGIPVIEDCAHAQGTAWRRKKVGAHVTAGCFSFQQSKSLASGEGGAVVTDNDDLADALWAVHNLGRTMEARRYDHTALGYNFRLCEFEATILRTQLKRLQEQTERRMRNGAVLGEAINATEGLRTLKADDRITQRGYYFYIVRYNADEWGGIHRNKFIKAMCAEGAHSFAAYGQPVHQNASYINGVVPHRVAGCPNAERAAAEEQVAFGSHALLDKANVRIIIDSLVKVRENLDELRRVE
ncbi:MAG: DegT/DnrJ/EryC1/StrS family aminotransferase [Armatimonadota bacterium]|nr:DegT/DnrJ/EryC1/StrS family aminotransferase [Armatimonadota bacterium]